RLRVIQSISMACAEQAAVHSALGEGYRAAGDLAKAIPSLEVAARRAPASEIVWLQLGSMLMEARQWIKAETALRRARTLRPDEPAAWATLGWAVWQQDK